MSKSSIANPLHWLYSGRAQSNASMGRQNSLQYLSVKQGSRSQGALSTDRSRFLTLIPCIGHHHVLRLTASRAASHRASWPHDCAIKVKTMNFPPPNLASEVLDMNLPVKNLASEVLDMNFPVKNLASEVHFVKAVP